MEKLVNKLGSMILLKKVKFYLETQTSYAKDTKRVYYNRMVNMLAWMEANIKDFRGNRLLFPLECNVFLPSAVRYLDTVTQMSKPTAIKAYLCLCSFIQDRCDMLYSSDTSVNKNTLNAFNVYLANSKKLISDKQSAINRLNSRTTQENKELEAENPHNLEHNPNRVGVLCTALY